MQAWNFSENGCLSLAAILIKKSSVNIKFVIYYLAGDLYEQQSCHRDNGP